MRFSEIEENSKKESSEKKDADISIDVGADPRRTPTDTEMKKSMLFQRKTMKDLQQGQFFYRQPDQRLRNLFEPNANLDRFVDYIGYIKDMAQKSAAVIKSLKLKNLD